MLKALKIRLYPDREQQTQFNQLLGCYRVVYNACLKKKMDEYTNNGNSFGLNELGHYFHHDLTKDNNYEWLREQNTKVLKQAVRQVLTAYKNFYEKNAKYPKFKSKRDNSNSCLFPLEAISKKNRYEEGRLSLANIRNVRFRCSNKYKNYLTKYKDGIRSATLSRRTDGCYMLSVLVQSDECLKKAPTKKFIGVDLGIKDF